MIGSKENQCNKNPNCLFFQCCSHLCWELCFLLDFFVQLCTEAEVNFDPGVQPAAPDCFKVTKFFSPVGDSSLPECKMRDLLLNKGQYL
ncbi:hypothetical protein Y1Q_0016344 [Alligator mississippiensis]|uniref:Uncharacterized protein n=1 Tax=Alligator mississippiensis TaxID=8496 RepID=A0A151N2U3_ALLMI|nr:hypothetical protein Y1Q_0016344 [Alligator mississippiensis]